MLSRLNFFCSDSNQYTPIPAEEPQQDNTALFNSIPADVIIYIASFLPPCDLMAFLLVTKRNLRLFEDFEGNNRIQFLDVTIPYQTSYQKPAEYTTSFNNVNHVLMANYYLGIQLNGIEVIEAENDRRACVRCALWVTFGSLVGLAVHAGGAALCDLVILPYFQAACGSSYGCPCCAGNICTSVMPDLGMDVGRTIAEKFLFDSLACYRCCNIAFCYMPCPLVCSLPAGIPICCVPHCSDDEGVETNISAIRRKYNAIESGSLIRKGIYQRVNNELREAKRDKAVHRFLFSKPPERVVMEVTDKGSPLHIKME